MTEIYSTDTDSGTLSVFEDANGTVRKIATIRLSKLKSQEEFLLKTLHGLSEKVRFGLVETQQ
ncbi:hypothetical protein J2S36_000945 [Arcanobacterium hippocoleae]|uniref:Uncharacterized protein n=1 Tax=Arcanobacterium hippocoleae TaxID=149017 RepID=A0ABU1T214_9ACTO|nr:hypothetical protein [Arcanobacterium hippocoleae]